MSSNKAALSGLKNHRVEKGNYGDYTYIYYKPKHQAIKDLVDVSVMPITIKAVLLYENEMESKVFVFSHWTHEQFLAHVMQSESLIDKQLHDFDQLKKADTVLSDTIQKHDSKKEELEKLIQACMKKGRTPPTEEMSTINALNQEFSKLDKKLMEL